MVGVGLTPRRGHNTRLTGETLEAARNAVMEFQSESRDPLAIDTVLRRRPGARGQLDQSGLDDLARGVGRQLERFRDR